MNDRIKKAAQKYKLKYLSGKGLGEAGCFYLKDYEEVFKIITEGNFTSNSYYRAILTALEAGFMIGYDKAVNENKKAAKEKSKTKAPVT